MRMKLHAPKTAALFIVFAAFWIGCGTPGAPQPPSLRIPKPVGDLQAIRKGDTVYLRWTVPTETTDGQGIKAHGTTQICRGSVTGQAGSCKDVVADLPTAANPQGEQEAADPIGRFIGGNRDFLTYTVKVNSPRNRNAGVSNAETVFLPPSLPPPSAVSARLVPDAVQLSWNNPQPTSSPNLNTNHIFRIFRTSKDEKPAKGKSARTAIGDVPAIPGPASFADKNFTWEKNYDYRVVGITQVISRDGKKLAEFESEDSPPVTVFAHDVFPPARPGGVQAVYSAIDSRKFIDLTWSPNDENDLAGYNVYRRSSESAAPQKINKDLVKTPSFRDENVIPGSTYTYTVTAVDARGNESPASDPANEKVPE